MREYCNGSSYRLILDGPGQLTPECCAAYVHERIVAMGGSATPKRVVLRFKVIYELEECAINKSFFARVGYEPKNDYYSHLMAANDSSNMHIILDLHCNTNPTINNCTLLYEVYKVFKKDGKLYVALQLNVSWLIEQ
jgi:hypothetical protein